MQELGLEMCLSLAFDGNPEILTPTAVHENYQQTNVTMIADVAYARTHFKTELS